MIACASASAKHYSSSNCKTLCDFFTFSLPAYPLLRDHDLHWTGVSVLFHDCDGQHEPEWQWERWPKSD